MIRGLLAASVAGLLLGAATAQAAPAPTCRPAGVGRDSFCDVAGVSIHYIDWGGHGTPVILLTGLGDTARIFDVLAPKLAREHRVIAVTRRGYGLSDHAQHDYSNAALVGDILGLMDRLGLSKASFVGHSIAGGELSTLGAQHPDRVDRLVYLDSAYNHSRALELTRGVPAEASPTKADLADLPALIHWREAVLQSRSPAVAANVRELMKQTPEGPKPRQTEAVGLAVLQGDVAAPPRYSAIPAPALAIYTSKDVVDQATPGTSPAQRAKVLAYSIHKLRPWMLRAQADFLEQKPCGVAIELPHSTHYFFLRAPEATAKLVNAYLATPQPCEWTAGELPKAAW